MESLLDRISALSNELSKSERKVAAAVLSQPQLTVTETIAQLANRAHVSEPTVFRFCKHFGSSGFPEFKIALSNSMRKESHRLPDRVKNGDSVEDIVTKIIESNISELNNLSRNLDSSVLARCIDLVAQARRIVIFAQGLSTATAVDFQQRLAILGIASEFYSDPSSMHLASVSLRSGELALCISASGENKDVISGAIESKLSGASVIAMCPADSALSKECILNLKCPRIFSLADDNLMVSRMMMQIILQIVISGVLLRRSDTINELKDRLLVARKRVYLEDQSLENDQKEEEQEAKNLAPNAPITSINWSSF